LSDSKVTTKLVTRITSEYHNLFVTKTDKFMSFAQTVK